MGTKPDVRPLVEVVHETARVISALLPDPDEISAVAALLVPGRARGGMGRVINNGYARRVNDYRAGTLLKRFNVALDLISGIKNHPDFRGVPAARAKVRELEAMLDEFRDADAELREALATDAELTEVADAFDNKKPVAPTGKGA